MKMKDIINHPLLSPLVDPVREVAKFARQPLEIGFGAFTYGFKTEMQYSKNPSKAVFEGARESLRAWADKGEGGFLIGIVCFVGGIGGSLLGGLMLGKAVAATAGMTAGLGAGLFAIPILAASTPLIVSCALSAAAAVVGVPIKGLPFMVNGLVKAGEFIANPTRYVALQAAQVAATQSAATTVLDDETAAFAEKIAALPTEERREKLEAFYKKFADDFDAVTGKTAREIDAMVHSGVPEERQTPVVPEFKKKPLDLGRKD